MEKVYEYCNHCEDEVKLEGVLLPQFCPDCGKVVVPCGALCESMNCSNCPIQAHIDYIKSSGYEIIPFDDEVIRVNGKTFERLDCVDNMDYYVGRMIFWLDPCFWDNREHTSDRALLMEICNEEMAILSNNAEVFLNEIYVEVIN